MDCGIIEKTKGISIQKLAELKGRLQEAFPLEDERYKNICVYACGSLGRMEMTDNSDLDLFFVSLHEGQEDPMCSRLNQYTFFSKLYEINRKMGFPDPSKGGEYWSFINREDFLDIGSRNEDYKNGFTARLLFILESKCIYNESAYERLMSETIEKYFVDYKDHQNEFYPLFLMNDILRYWYTLTLNYEYRRDSKDEPNKKNWKRLKLKYARLITCFSMLACLYHKNITPEYVIACTQMTPMERLDKLALETEETGSIVQKIKAEYEWFLSMRQEMDNGLDEGDGWDQAFRRAEIFHELLIHELMSKLSQSYPELRSRTDVY